MIGISVVQNFILLWGTFVSVISEWIKIGIYLFSLHFRFSAVNTELPINSVWSLSPTPVILRITTIFYPICYRMDTPVSYIPWYLFLCEYWLSYANLHFLLLIFGFLMIRTSGEISLALDMLIITTISSSRILEDGNPYIIETLVIFWMNTGQATQFFIFRYSDLVSWWTQNIRYSVLVSKNGRKMAQVKEILGTNTFFLPYCRLWIFTLL